ncbi:MAG: urea ABC transporter permease subunit UrtC, partial [Hyphomicrobiales bacterium]
GKSWFTGAFPEYWLFALGGLFVLVTLLLPKGIVGTLRDGWARLRPAKQVAVEGDTPKKTVDQTNSQPQAAE